MRMMTFSGRTAKEILRDPLNIAFGVGFPVVLLLLLTIIQSNVPVSLFELDQLTPGISVFGLSFMTLFSATLIAKDRSSSLLQRLYTTPLTALDYILGYTLPVLPIALGQGIVCYLVAVILGMQVKVGVIYAIIGLIPPSIFFIAMGLLCGSIFNDKQVGGICGALLSNLTAWLSGAWFDLNLVGGAFKTFANLLPFSHATEMERALLAGNLEGAFEHLWWVIGYEVTFVVIAVIVFMQKMKKN